MKTLTFNIHTTYENKKLIDNHQSEYSCVLRKVYNNLDLVKDKSFIKEIRDYHNLHAKMYDYIVLEALRWDKIKREEEAELTARVKRLRKDIKKAPKHKRGKINEKIQRLETSIKKDLVFGSIYLARKLTQNPHDTDLRDEWREKRKYMMVIQGEASRNGNRYFDISELHKGIIYYTPERGVRMKLTFDIRGNNRLKDINDIQCLAMHKIMPISIKLSSDEIHISYDECVVNDTKFEEDKIKKDLNKQNLTETQYKAKLHQEHVKHDNKILRGKLKKRYCGLDLNPNGIGLIIADCLEDSIDVEPTIIYKEFIDFDELNVKLGLKSNDDKQIKQNNKRKHEIAEVVKHIFETIEHYKVANFVTEDLDFSKKENDLGNKSSNRYINNLWCRTLLKNLFTKYTNTQGVKHIPVKAAYSSFIGNIKYKEFDPIAAAIEITRRGMVKFMKGCSIYPKYDIPWSTSDLVKEFSLPNEMHEKIKECQTFKALYNIISTSKKSVRRKESKYLDDFLANYLGNSKKSKVKIYSSH